MVFIIREDNEGAAYSQGSGRAPWYNGGHIGCRTSWRILDIHSAKARWKSMDPWNSYWGISGQSNTPSPPSEGSTVDVSKEAEITIGITALWIRIIAAIVILFGDHLATQVTKKCSKPHHDMKHRKLESLRAATHFSTLQNVATQQKHHS